MDIALLNVKITIQKAEYKVDKIGNRKAVWNDFYTCYATVSGESGKESFVAGMVSDLVDITFTVRYCEKLKLINSTQHRVSFQEDIFNIQAIDHMNYKRKALKLLCKKERKSGTKGIH